MGSSLAIACVMIYGFAALAANISIANASVICEIAQRPPADVFVAIAIVVAAMVLALVSMRVLAPGFAMESIRLPLPFVL
jgi:hypothetical protein